MSGAGRLVVGFDGSEFAQDAVRWAIAWAYHTGMEVDLLCSVDVPDGWNRITEELRQDYRNRRFRYVERLREEHPDLRISGHFTTDAVVPAMEHALAKGYYAVMASSGDKLPPAGPDRSLSTAVSPRPGGTPVIVLPPAVTELQGDRVVVGLRPESDDTPLNYGLWAARTLQKKLQLVYVTDTGEKMDARWLEELAIKVRADNPDLDIETHAMAGSATEELIKMSVAAVLLVIGTAKQGIFRPGAYSDLGRALLLRGSSALAVVRPPR